MAVGRRPRLTDCLRWARPPFTRALRPTRVHFTRTFFTLPTSRTTNDHGGARRDISSPSQWARDLTGVRRRKKSTRHLLSCPFGDAKKVLIGGSLFFSASIIRDERASPERLTR